jgi:hypothetical protein
MQIDYKDKKSLQWWSDQIWASAERVGEINFHSNLFFTTSGSVGTLMKWKRSLQKGGNIFFLVEDNETSNMKQGCQKSKLGICKIIKSHHVSTAVQGKNRISCLHLKMRKFAAVLQYNFIWSSGLRRRFTVMCSILVLSVKIYNHLDLY